MLNFVVYGAKQFSCSAQSIGSDLMVMFQAYTSWLTSNSRQFFHYKQISLYICNSKQQDCGNYKSNKNIFSSHMDHSDRVNHIDHCVLISHLYYVCLLKSYSKHKSHLRKLYNLGVDWGSKISIANDRLLNMQVRLTFCIINRLFDRSPLIRLHFGPLFLLNILVWYLYLLCWFNHSILTFITTTFVCFSILWSLQKKCRDPAFQHSGI